MAEETKVEEKVEEKTEATAAPAEETKAEEVKPNPLQRTIELTISRKELDARVAKALREKAKKAKFHGFRPGHAPVSYTHLDVYKRQVGQHVDAHVKEPADDGGRKSKTDGNRNSAHQHENKKNQQNQSGIGHQRIKHDLLLEVLFLNIFNSALKNSDNNERREKRRGYGVEPNRNIQRLRGNV